MARPDIASLNLNHIKLVEDVQYHLSDIVPKLYERGIIGPLTKDSVLDQTISAYHRAETLLASVAKRIETDSAPPSVFLALIVVLKSFPSLLHLANVLEESHSHGTLCDVPGTTVQPLPREISEALEVVKKFLEEQPDERLRIEGERVWNCMQPLAL